MGGVAAIVRGVGPRGRHLFRRTDDGAVPRLCSAVAVILPHGIAAPVHQQPGLLLRRLHLRRAGDAGLAALPSDARCAVADCHHSCVRAAIGASVLAMDRAAGARPAACAARQCHSGNAIAGCAPACQGRAAHCRINGGSDSVERNRARDSARAGPPHRPGRTYQRLGAGFCIGQTPAGSDARDA